MDESRKQFEEWAVSEEGDLDVTKIRNERLGIEAYRSTKTFDAWRGWQAARPLTERSRADVLEEAAKVCDSECARILSKQTPNPPYGSTDEAVNQNLRMIAVVLPDMANAIRALASSPSGKPGGEG